MHENSVRTTTRPEIPGHIVDYLADSYPHNHNYTVSNGTLIPRKKLASRYDTLQPLYPKPLTSLLDIGCSKGFFVISAALEPECHRAFGIDIDLAELEACEAVKRNLGVSHARFEHLFLHELADRINDFGGPFQTILIINTYQYLYFGSGRSSDCYGDHAEIFEMLRHVCDGRILFNNRTELSDCQTGCQEAERRENYSTDRIFSGASNFFDVTKQGTYGKYPLWTMDAR